MNTIYTHAEQAAARFDNWADTYGEERISPWFAHYQNLAIERLNLQPGDNFLDIGCGVGKAVAMAVGKVHPGQACGIDISPKMIEKARRLFGEHSSVDFEVADSEAIPFDDNHFDAVLCTHSFHHYLKPQAVLCEIKRVLKPGGRFVLVDSARDVSLAMWLQDRGRRYLERSHVRYYTVDEIRELLRDANLALSSEIEIVRKFMDHGKMFTGLFIAETKASHSPSSR